ncbi:polysaccharide lyase family 8 super-sandwich domain-containing protein [Paraglaciecola sp. L3A3]|uniref:polysaccharide lyase family 8 super-sandwich domain-containing protein n=1 Tax=Paraglaciecola sp. L3A3 TaxID=2686358 RepID=UPI00131E72EF|nr:polysaccharide lyase family 8 super-sandwich domain-containing protein [Paraglaciecola sp. L3A3]
MFIGKLKRTATKLWLWITIIASLVLHSPFTYAKEDIEIIHERVKQDLLGTAINDKQVKKVLSTIRSNGTWANINYKDVSLTGFQHNVHLDNMLLLSRSYNLEGSKYFKNSKVKKSIEKALTYWLKHDFISDNWWDNQIGIPNDLVTLILLMDGELSESLIEKTQPIIGRATTDSTGARPGGDRIKIANIQAKNLLHYRDVIKLSEVIKVIEGEIKPTAPINLSYGYGYTEMETGLGTSAAEGRGLQYDNSFHHRTDAVNNTLSYGLSYARAFVMWADYTTGTRFALSPAKLEHLIDYFLDGICKMAAFGKYPDIGSKNRSISRRGSLSAYSAVMAEQLLSASDYRKVELQEIADIRNNDIKPTISHATYFWLSDHLTYQRPNFFTSVRMYSSRVHNMESAYNSEGLLNHYRGDGANHISVTGDEYFDIAPVFDYQKIPGTTILQKPELPSTDEIQKLGLSNFVGAATDGMYATVGFDFKSPHDPLIARKAWFFFDDEYVCLGAGISTILDYPVATTLNQSLLRGNVTLSSESQISTLQKGEKQYNKVDWIYHNGVGYLFPTPQKIMLKNNKATGSWFKINQQNSTPKGEVKQDVFKLWIDHGYAPSDDTYEYIVVPGTNIENIQKYSEKNVKILSNTPYIQAVANKNLGLYQAVFYKAGVIELEENIILSASSPGIFLLEIKGGNVTKITASDPSHYLQELHFSLSTRILAEQENYKSVWDEKKQKSNISISLPQGVYTGSSVSITL